MPWKDGCFAVQMQREEARGGGGLGEREEFLREWVFELWLLEEGEDIPGREECMKKGRNVVRWHRSATGFSGLLSCSSCVTCWWWKGKLTEGLCVLLRNLVYPLVESEFIYPKALFKGGA